MSSYQQQVTSPEGDLFKPAGTNWPGPVADLDELMAMDTGPERHEDALRSMLVAKAVQHEIIPRLVLAHKAVAPPTVPAGRALTRIQPEDVALLTELVMHEDDSAVRESMDALRDRGVEVEAIFTDLLVPVARHLGELWERDLCDFTEVTLGMGRLQRIVREQSASRPALARARTDNPHSRRLLLVPAPGEQHTFGLSLVAEYFHRAGWEVETHLAPESPLEQVVREQWFDVVGLTMSNIGRIDAVNALLARVRAASLNPHVSIIAGGSIFGAYPEDAKRLEADAIVTDVAQAAAQADRRLAALRLRFF
ncbi:MAG: cobalamin B12-binding domain-containing protein [Hydrogenophaga sp.]|nr:cobalamin B12-binding domain-containing protein [Hydrogenophaga sp.]